jgi:hypothetical protein
MSQAHTVRFGKTSSNRKCIWIGETNTNWAYPNVTVTEVTAGYIATSAGWDNDWDINLVTSFDSVQSNHIHDSSDVFSSGNSTVMASQVYEGTGKVTSNSTTIMVSVNIVAPKDNPKLHITAITGASESHGDSDPAVAVGWRIGGETSSPASYTAVHGTIGNRENRFLGLGNFWVQDTMSGYNVNHNYQIKPVMFCRSITTVGVSSGQSLNVSLFVGSENTINWGTDQDNDQNDGFTSSITVIAI